MENDNVKSKNKFLINNMQKQKSIISLNTIPATVFSIVLIVGLGAVIGLWAYEIFETDKKLSLYNNICNDNNIAQKRDKVDDEYFGNEFIQVKSPQENATIKSPVLISGMANVFEANVRVRMKDDNKNILANTFITASGAYDKLYPFEKEISYSAPTSQNGVIEVFEESSKDGSEINKIIIHVFFEDYMDVSGWKTYKDEEYRFEVKYPNNFLFQEPNVTAANSTIEKFSSKCPVIDGAEGEKKIINSKEYCLYRTDEGGAGHTYTTYSHTIISANKIYTIKLVLDSINCGVYITETDDFKNCEKSNKNAPNTMEKILSTFKFIEK